MGWISFDHPDHEGFVVALVERDGVSPLSGCYRELQYPGDNQERNDVVRIQAGCSCGWRSAYLVPGRGVEHTPSGGSILLPSYSPYAAWVTEADEERCRKLWTVHTREPLPEQAEVAIGARTGSWGY